RPHHGTGGAQENPLTVRDRARNRAPAAWVGRGRVIVTGSDQTSRLVMDRPQGTRSLAPGSGKIRNAVPGWPERIHAVLSAADVRQVPYVPDSGHARLIELCHADPDMHALPLTTEEEGVALLAGAWLGGQRGVLLMQSSGSGNCTNMLGMIVECR